jgi:hypothetical protein
MTAQPDACVLERCYEARLAYFALTERELRK